VFACSGLRFILLTHPAASFPLKLKWQTDLGSSTYERPAYQNGLVLFPANTFIGSHWYGIDASTGQEIWSQRVRRNSFLRCVTTKYLVVSGSEALLTLDINDGKVVWERERAYTATCSEDMVFYSGVPRDSARAVSIENGQILWDFYDEMRSRVELKKFTTAGTLIYNPDAEQLIAGGGVTIEPTSGKMLRVFAPSFVAYPPLEDGRGNIYVVDRGELFVGGTVRDAQTGEIIHKEGRYSTGTSPTVTLDTMYLVSGSQIIAFDRGTYDVKWIYSPTVNYTALSPVTILDEVGYVIYSDATLRAIDLETGQELGYWQPGILDRWFWPVCSPFPFLCIADETGVGMTISEDTLFVSFGDGKLYAFGE